ncbi:MAG: hypothetical protein KAT12_03505 [Gammaproteobacteria bacterium]|nr:hypothetical protein [Gammaproteobacteria bacterium]
MAASEQDRILAKKNVKSTLRQLVDIINEDRVNDAKSIVFRDFGIIFASFVRGTLLAFITIMKHEKLHFHADSGLGK